MLPYLKISPERVLKIPCSTVVSNSEELQLTNISEHPFVAFKIKTTAPKKYLVKPSAGVVARGSTVTVQITLQPLQEEPKKPCTDRFLIQATLVPTEEPLPRDDWKNVPKSDVQDTRLNVIYKPTGPSSTVDARSGDSAATVSGSSVREQRDDLASGAAGGASGNASEKGRYEQLVEYAMAVERHKEELVLENQALKRQLEARGSGSVSEMWHIPVYVFVFIMAWYLYGYSSRWSSSSEDA